jgi:adenine-specific DNA methylase
VLDYSKSFIETQFPVSKISKESYKERKANLGQTLTGLGKWWGRKPLILVRATLLGILMPASEDPIKDRKIFLKILTMDEDGLWLRKFKPISLKDLYKSLNSLKIEKYFDLSSTASKPKYKKGITKEDKEYLQKIVFNRLSYDNKLIYCLRPENIKLEDENAWDEINEHLETKAFSIEELTKQLGEKRFGRTPRVGDCFSGGGSIPFESARMGADVYASDLNPVATMLTWASLNIAGTSDDEVAKLKEFQKKVYDTVDKQIIEWGIENNEVGDRADSYLYCNETVCPECGYNVPLAPSWVIGKGTKTVALLKDNNCNGFDINIIMDATKEQFNESSKMITIKSGKMYCPHCKMETPITSIRGDIKDEKGNTISGLRQWEETDCLGQANDVFQERLYAIRYISNGKRYYKTPTEYDLGNEEKTVNILKKYFIDWQQKGFIPSASIEKGYNTDQPIRERGWHYWHQLFNSRQLILSALIVREILSTAKTKEEFVFGALGVNKIVDWSSKLCIWNVGAGVETTQNTFTTQALNTLYNYGARGFSKYDKNFLIEPNNSKITNINTVNVIDARNVNYGNDIWITDPPYADAVNYHELTEYFLAWDKPIIEKAFPEWYSNSKRVLAVKGTGNDFNQSMIEIYRNLANNMPDNGYQVVMFTHQDVKVWSELAMILWSAGLHVVSAWNIATETESGGLKAGGNYVKGTVLLVLKKQMSTETAFQDELYEEIKNEVQSIIESMKSLDDKDDPDFNDADYLLASYASSLKVLTAYKEIDGIDVKYWLSQARDAKEENPVESLINKAVRIANDYLIPEGFDKSYWKDLKREERFYIRGLEVEMSGVLKISSYQDLARGFGVHNYADMFENFKANSARLKTPSEYKMLFLGGNGFNSTLLRHLLVALNEVTVNDSTVEGRAYLKDVYKEDNQYWYKKPLMIELLSFVSNLEFIDHMKHWHEHAYSAKLLKEALKNEGV